MCDVCGVHVYPGVLKKSRFWLQINSFELFQSIELGDIENSALRLLQRKASRLLPIYCIVFTIINRAEHHYTCMLIVTAIASGMKIFLLV